MKALLTRKEILVLKIVLIKLTIIQLGYYALSLVEHNLFIELKMRFHSNMIIIILNFIISLTFIWFNWKKLPYSKSKKIDNTLMMLFLGIIGMWIWLPNQKELEKIKKNTD